MGNNNDENNQQDPKDHLAAINKLYPEIAKLIDAELAKHPDLKNFELHGLTLQPKQKNNANKAFVAPRAVEHGGDFCKKCTTPSGAEITRCEPGPCP